MTETVSTTKLFVGGLPREIRGYQLRELFSPFGEIVFATVKLDRETRKSRGFGFVEFVNAEDATKAQAEMHEKEIEWRKIKVDFAKENPDRIQYKQEKNNENTETSEEDQNNE